MHGPNGLLWRRPGPCLVPMAPIGLLWKKFGPCLVPLASSGGGQPCMVPMASCGGGLAPSPQLDLVLAPCGGGLGPSPQLDLVLAPCVGGLAPLPRCSWSCLHPCMHASMQQTMQDSSAGVHALTLPDRGLQLGCIIEDQPPQPLPAPRAHAGFLKGCLSSVHYPLAAVILFQNRLAPLCRLGSRN